MRGIYEADAHSSLTHGRSRGLPVRSLFKAVLQQIDRLSIVISYPELA